MNCDVLAIGGGPAGTAAAIACARAGLSVVLIESQAFPRHRPGETLHPGVEPLLERLSVAESVRAAGFLRHPGIWLEHSGETEFQPYGGDADGPWLGFQAPRAEFDSLLLSAARSAGVAIYQPCHALRVVRRGGRVAGAETTVGPIEARFTLDASGSAAWLARELALPIERATQKLFAHYAYMRGECAARDEAPRFEYRSDGWLWTARIRPGLYHWTRLLDGGARPRQGWVPREFAGLESLGAVRGVDVTWRLLDRCAGPGYFVLGDAAAVTDPSSSQGVLQALMSGMLAAHLVKKRLLKGAPESSLAAEYAHFVHSHFRFALSTHFGRPGAKRIEKSLDPAGMSARAT